MKLIISNHLIVFVEYTNYRIYYLHLLEHKVYAVNFLFLKYLNYLQKNKFPKIGSTLFNLM